MKRLLLLALLLLPGCVTQDKIFTQPAERAWVRHRQINDGFVCYDMIEVWCENGWWEITKRKKACP